MAGEVARVFIEITGSGTGAVAAIGETDAALKGLQGTADRSNGMLAGLAGGLVKVGAAAAAAGAVVAGVSLKMSADLQQKMMLVRTQAHDTTDNLGQMTSKVVDLSKEVGLSADKLAEGLYHVTSVGYRGAEAMDILKVAAQGARVGNADLDSTTYALTSVMNTFGLSAKDAQSTMATLNAVVGAGDMRFQDLNGAISTGFFAAGETFGVSIQSMGAALAYLTDRGASAEESATRLKMSINLLGAPTHQATKILTDLGLTQDEVKTRTTAMEEALKKSGVSTTVLSSDLRKPDGIMVALKDLRDHMIAGGLSAEEAAAVLSRAFGGGRSGAAIMSMIQHLDILGQKFDVVNSGAARFGADWTDTQKTFNFQLDRLRTNVEALAIQFGNRLLPAATTLIGYLADHIATIEGWASGIERLATGVQSFLNSVGIGRTTVGPQEAQQKFRAGERTETGGWGPSRSTGEMFRAGERGEMGTSGVTSQMGSAAFGRQAAELTKQIATALADAFREAIRSIDWAELGRQLASNAASFIGSFLDNLGWAGAVTKALVAAFVALKIAMAIDWVLGFAAAIRVVNAEQGGLILVTRLLRIEWAATRLETAAIAAMYAWDWIVANVKTAAAFAAAKVEIVAGWVATAIESGVNAAKAAASWVASAATSSAAWIADKTGALAAIVAGWVSTAAAAVVNAVKAAAAWVAAAAASAAGWVRTAAVAIASYISTVAAANPNSNAAAIVWMAGQVKIAAGWVATQVKAVASFIATSVAAAEHAVRAAAAWIAAQVTTAAGWVRTAGIAVASFVTTRVSATTQAGQSLAAWVAAQLSAGAGWVRTQIVAVGSFLATKLAAVANAAAAAAAWVAANVAMLAATLRTVGGMILMNTWGIIVKIATLAWAAAQWLLNAALVANPIGLVIVAIALLVAGIIWAYNNVGWFHDAVNKAWKLLQELGSWIQGTLWPIIQGLGTKFAEVAGQMAESAKSLARSLIDHIGNGLNQAISLFRGFIEAINAILGKFGIEGVKVEGVLKAGLDVPGMKRAVGLATGGMITNGPYVIGEGAAAHPEWVLPSDPAHRGRALDLLGSYVKAIGLAGGGIAGGNPYPSGQCTYYVYSRFPGIPLDGNATDWGGLPLKHVGTPAAGEIVVYKAGGHYSGYGHVAVVEGGTGPGGTFPVSEMNYKGLGVVDQRMSDMTDVETFLIPGVPGVGGPGGGMIGGGANIAGPLIDAAMNLAMGSIGNLPEWIRGLAKAIVEKIAGGAKGKLSSFVGGTVSGTVSGSHADWLHAAEQAAGVGSDWDTGLGIIIQHESGWNPNASNNWDSNAQAGNASVGLGQLTGTNRARYEPDHSPVGQIIGIIRYVLDRYHSIGNVPGVRSVLSGGGYVPYDAGGLLAPGLTLAWNGTGSHEVVSPAGAGGLGELVAEQRRTNAYLHAILHDQNAPAGGYAANLRAG